MDYRKNKVIEKLKQDKLTICLKINITHNIPVEIAALCGADCVWLDMEHVPTDYAEVERGILAAKAGGIETIVRTPRGAYSNITRPLELDASGVMVPHVMNLEDAKRVVYYTKFHPVGRRPMDGGNADGMYCLLEPEKYIRYSNEEKLTIIQIEDVEALDELDEIAALEGIDMLFFGPADFSQSVGEPLNTANARTMEAKRKVAEAARKHGKYAGTTGGTANLEGLYDMGYRFISLGADVAGLSSYFSSIVAEVRRKGF